MKVQLKSESAKPLENPIPVAQWFMEKNYKSIQRIAKFILATNPDSSAKGACKDLLNGKYASAKEVKADLKLVKDYLKLITDKAFKEAQENLSM